MQDSIIVVREQYLQAQVTGDQRGALRIVREAVADGHSVRAVQEGVIQAAQHEIGRLWQENRLSIAHEHMATAISQMALVHLFELAPAPRANGRTIVVACVEGELHDLPARLVADYLESEGFAVRFLGANVPTESLGRLLAEDPPDLLALSVTMSFNVAGLRAAVAAVRERLPGLQIAAGGHALAWAPELAEQIGVLVVGAKSEDIVAGLLRQLPGGER
jgi:methanogenic corrinoid protein MtbC1